MNGMKDPEACQATTPEEQARTKRLLRHHEIERLAEKLLLAYASGPRERTYWSVLSEAEMFVDALEQKRQDAARLL